MISDLKVLANKPDDLNFTALLQVMGTAKQILPAVINVINAFETYHYLRNQRTENKTNLKDSSSSLLSLPEDPRDNMWYDETLPILDRGKLLGGTLNHIIVYLTSDENVGTYSFLPRRILGLGKKLE